LALKYNTKLLRVLQALFLIFLYFLEQQS